MLVIIYIYDLVILVCQLVFFNILFNCLKYFFCYLIWLIVEFGIGICGIFIKFDMIMKCLDGVVLSYEKF